MMIECEVKTGQTVESIENTRREGGDGVVVQGSNRIMLKEGVLSKEWTEKTGQTVEPIENTRRERSDGVVVQE